MQRRQSSVCATRTRGCLRREQRLAPYLVLLREEFTVRRKFPSCPVGSYPTLSPLPSGDGGLLSVALVFPRNIVRGILLFKRTPCSVQSGLSSTGQNAPPRLPAIATFTLNIITCLSICKVLSLKNKQKKRG